jgi:CBS domain containing-hemolysin-like protein
MTGEELGAAPLAAGPALVAVLVLIGINALCVFNEFALVALAPTRVQALAEGPNRLGRTLARQAHQLDNYIAADQLGITITSIAAGWIGQPAVSRLLDGPIGALGLPEAVSAPLVAGILAFTLITATQMVLGELVPKSISLRHAERVGLLIAVPIEVMALVLRPLTIALNGIGALILRPFGIDAGMASHHQALGLDELAGAISASSAAGLLEVNPSTIENALRFGELTARDVMIPNTRVVALHADDTLADVMETARAAHHVRYPVLDDGDDVLGYLHLADLAGMLAGDRPAEPDGAWRSRIRPLIAIPEGASLESVLAQLGGAGQQMALVVDEYGSSIGMVGINDLLRGLVAPPSVGDTGDGPRDAGSLIRDLHPELAAALQALDPMADTINGVLITTLQRVPAVGDEVRAGPYRLRITRASDVRAEEIVVERDPGDS